MRLHLYQNGKEIYSKEIPEHRIERIRRLLPEYMVHMALNGRVAAVLEDLEHTNLICVINQRSRAHVIIEGNQIESGGETLR